LEALKKTLLLLLAGASCAFAQKSFFGVDAGVNLANQRVHEEYFQSVSYGTPMISTSFFQNVVRPSVGLFYQIGIGEKMGVRFKAQYLCLGYKNKGGIPDRLEINYLCFPVTFHYSITPKLGVTVGPYLCFTLGGTKVNGKEITSTYHKNDNGLNLGFEYEVYKNISLGANYILGLKNIWLNDNIGQPYYGTIGETQYTNRAMQFTVIYKFKKTN
jgi:hypothetical protein